MKAFTVASVGVLLGWIGSVHSEPTTSQKEKVFDYPMRDIDQSSEKFRRIYETVAEADYQTRLKQQTSYTVEILQSIGKGLFRIREGETYYALRLPDERLYPDGTKLQLPIIPTSEVFQYKTVLGATATLAVVELAPRIDRISKADFVAGLKNGKSMTIALRVGDRGCRTCYGSGRLIGGLGEESRTCPDCQGSKTEAIMKAFRIAW